MKLRIKFSKHGAVRYIGHLDMQRYFQRLNRRAGLRVVYSEGFSPHQKMSFAMPLSVGYESDAEYFDLEVSEAESSKTVISRMNSQQAEGIAVTDCVLLPEGSENAMASVRAADYDITFREGYEPPFDIKASISALKDSSVFIVKKPVKKPKRAGRIKKASYDTRTMEPGVDGDNQSAAPEYREADIRPYIYDITADAEGGIHMQLSAGSENNIKPELVMGSLYEKAGYALDKFALMITRHELYTRLSDGADLVPLSGVGKEF